jgi:AraC family transcriptional regulator, regulatory protein of adaptative response / methylated-DNA-[protein]-cysteine methyltransferase
MKRAQLNEEQCWQAVENRDAQRDGAFFYGVLTTGVYCKPSCPSRRAKRENVKFYATSAEAEADGLRACLRCRPLIAAKDDPWAARIRKVCRYIEQHIEQDSDELLTLADFSREAQTDSFQLQRKFKAIVGVSPKQYLDDLRLQKFKTALRTEKNEGVTAAIYEAGYSSSSRLYEKTDTRLGMTPMEYRAGGRGVEITWSAAKTPLGLMMVGATDRGLCFVQFGEDAAELRATLEREYPNAALKPMAEPAAPEFTEWMGALNRYLAGEEEDLRLPVHVRATAFQLKVWKYLQAIPKGSVESYQEVARGVGQPRAARAVARACASNHVAIVIPCHRVIRGNGELGGYRWGMERKRVLIDTERKKRNSVL